MRIRSSGVPCYGLSLLSPVINVSWCLPVDLDLTLFSRFLGQGRQVARCVYALPLLCLFAARFNRLNVTFTEVPLQA